MDKEQINNNFIESFETLKYILEVKFGNDVKDIKYNVNPGISDEGLVDMEGELLIEIFYNEPDLTILASRLRKVDITLNEVFGSYYFTDEGKLVKNRVPAILMGVSHMLYDLNLDYINESVKIIIGLILFDL